MPCRTTRDLYAYLGDRLGALAGVQTVDTAPVLRRVKAFTWTPLCHLSRKCKMQPIDYAMCVIGLLTG